MPALAPAPHPEQEARPPPPTEGSMDAVEIVVLLSTVLADVWALLDMTTEYSEVTRAE